MRSLSLVFLAAILALAAVVPAAAAEPPAVDAEDEQLLRAANVPADGAGLLAFFRGRTLDDAGQKRVGGLIRDLGDNTFPVREKASRDLVAVGPPALAGLRRALATADPEVRNRARDCIEAIEQKKGGPLAAAAARLLRTQGPAGAAAVLVAYVPFADDEAVEEEVRLALTAVGVRDGKLDPALPAALRDPAPARRAVAALVTGRFGTAAERDAARVLLTDDDPRVRLAAARGLLAARDKTVVPALLALLSEGPAAVGSQAEDLLACLADGKGPGESFGEDDAGRRKARDAWEAWWKAHADALDLAKADIDLPMGDPALRAREAVRQFLTAVIKGDAAGFARTSDVPFSLGGVVVLGSREELDKVLLQVKQAGGQVKLNFSVTGAGSLEEHLKTAPKQEKDFLLKGNRVGLRVVYVTMTNDGRQEPAAAYVRVTGNRARVIGLGEARKMSK